MEGQKKRRKKRDNIRGRERLVLARDMQRGNKRILVTKGTKVAGQPGSLSLTSINRERRVESWPIAIEIRQKEVENRLANREALIQPRFPAKRQSGTNPRSLRGVPFAPSHLAPCRGFLSPSAFTLSTATYRNQTRATSGRAAVSRAAHRRNFFDVPPPPSLWLSIARERERGFVTVSSLADPVGGFIRSSWRWSGNKTGYRYINSGRPF